MEYIECETPRYIDASRVPNDRFWEGMSDKEKAKVLSWFLAAPTADVEPVRHGEWREETEYYDDEYSECNLRKVFVCSLCGRTEKYKQPYCNCGARMDGGNK